MRGSARIGAKPLTEANLIRLKRVKASAGSYKTLGALAIQAAVEEGIEVPSIHGATQTLRQAYLGNRLSVWSTRWVLNAINKLDEAPMQRGNGKHVPPTDVPPPMVGVNPDWKQKYEEKREEALRLSGNLRGAHSQVDQLHRDLAQMRADLEHIKNDLEEMTSTLQEIVLSDASDLATVQVKAARWLIAKQITDEADND
jgi:hypothetical protein